jgi:hypothetical protein
VAAPILPQDVTEHLETAIQLSNRCVYLRFLDEAELLLAFNLPTAAVLVSGVVLEAILAGLREQRDSENRQRMERWFELRNCVAEAQAPAVTLDPARKRVEDVRASLTRESKVGPRLAPMKAPAEASRQVRGKYQFVPTSSAEFIGRKADVPIGGNEAGSAAGRRRGDRGVRSGRRRGALRRGVGGRGIGDPTGGDSGGSRDRLLRVGNRCQKRNWQAGRLVAGLDPLFG